jgi:RNA polymerase sigma-70 factor (ECF subfamily)
LEHATDERLLIEAAQRDPSRFAELYENNFLRVYAFIARRVGNREEAQDLTAEVFHEALAGLARFEWRGAPFVTWLLGIAANLLSKRWEKLGKRREFPADDVDELGFDQNTEQRTMLFQLVDRLPPDQRHVILLRFVEQRTLREIAHELQRSEGAIKQLQLRALENLRAKVKEKS